MYLKTCYRISYRATAKSKATREKEARESAEAEAKKGKKGTKKQQQDKDKKKHEDLANEFDLPNHFDKETKKVRDIYLSSIFFVVVENGIELNLPVTKCLLSLYTDQKC